jgi:uncharacterized membrane protein YhaH (DUF805 family)
MKGSVIGFDRDTNTGAISGHNGNRYDFVTLDWHGQNAPRQGDLVDFQAVDQRATEIYLIEPGYVTPSFFEFYFSPSGRISRSQYWLRFLLPYIAVILIIELATAIVGSESILYVVVSALYTIFYLVALWPSIATLVKRIHDRNKSGWIILYLIVPAILFTIMLIAGMALAFSTVEAGGSLSFTGTAGALGLLAIILGCVVLGTNMWFFVEFGCLRGTIGANKYGPDPLR